MSNCTYSNHMSVLKPSLPHYTAELDYVSTPVTVTFQCNQERATVCIPILNDCVQEPKGQLHPIDDTLCPDSHIPQTRVTLQHHPSTSRGRLPLCPTSSQTPSILPPDGDPRQQTGLLPDRHPLHHRRRRKKMVRTT